VYIDICRPKKYGDNFLFSSSLFRYLSLYVYLSFKILSLVLAWMLQ